MPSAFLCGTVVDHVHWLMFECIVPAPPSTAVCSTPDGCSHAALTRRSCPHTVVALTLCSCSVWRATGDPLCTSSVAICVDGWRQRDGLGHRTALHGDTEGQGQVHAAAAAVCFWWTCPPEGRGSETHALHAAARFTGSCVSGTSTNPDRLGAVVGCCGLLWDACDTCHAMVLTCSRSHAMPWCSHAHAHMLVLMLTCSCSHAHAHICMPHGRCASAIS